MIDKNYFDEKLDGVMRKLDQIVAIYDNRMDRFETRMDRFETRMDRFETRMIHLEDKMDCQILELKEMNARMDARVTSLEEWRNISSR